MFQNHSLASAQATSDEDLEATIVSLLDQIKGYKAAYESLDKKSTEVGDSFAELFPSYNALYTEAALNFNRIAADLAGLAPDQETTQKRAGRGDDREEFGSERSKQDKPDKPDKPDGRSDPAPMSVNKLYYKIAQLAHPDKTDDPSLHELFIRAKEAKKTNALSVLIEILVSIQGDVEIEGASILSEEDLRADRLARISTLRQELEAVTLRYNQLKSSPMAKVVDLALAGTEMAKARAEILYKTTLLDRVRMLETKASSMKQDLAFRGSLRKSKASPD